MANKKTSEETAAAALTGAELVRVTQSGESVRTTAQDIADLASTGGSASVVTTIAGTTAGSALCQQTVQGAGAKEVVVALVGYRNSTGTPQTYDFPTAFDHTPILWPNSDPEATVSTTTLTLPASMAGAIDAVIVIKGF